MSPHFECRYSVRSLQVDYTFGSLVGAIRSLEQTITPDDLELLLWHWHTFKGKFSISRSWTIFLTLPVRALPP